MQEFYQNLTRKLAARPEDAADLVRSLKRFEVVTISPEIIEDAMILHSARKTSFWDSLIVACAAFANCGTLYSEDMGHGQSVKGVRIVNPFA